MAKRVLITGITGQDGAYWARYLLDHGYEVFGTYRRSTAANRWRLEELRIADKLSPPLRGLEFVTRKATAGLARIWHGHQEVVELGDLRANRDWGFAEDFVHEELKADYPLAKIPTGQFAANEAYFHLLLFAYNLVNWFKRRLCLPAEYHPMTLGTLRRRLLMIPGEFVHTRQGPTLRLPSSPIEQEGIRHALTRVDRFRF